jgi:hypothetical protein
MFSSPHNLPGRRILFRLSAGLIVFLFSGSTFAGENESPFPEIKSKFSSKSKSYLMQGEVINYCNKLKVIFDEGKLYKRRDEIGYDYYFSGSGRLHMLDTTWFEVTWRHSFREQRTLEFANAYICATNFQEYLSLDPRGWQEDKIGREQWQELQFMVNAPERYFWVNLSGELGIWPDRGMLSPPIWMQFRLTDGKNLVIYITPDLKEQLSIFQTKLNFERPYLIAGSRVDTCLGIPMIEFDSTVISLDLKSYGKFEVASTIYFAQGSDLRGMNLSLPTWFKVDSVLDVYNDPLPFIKKKNRNYLYLAPRPAPVGVPDRVSVYYRGKYLKPQYEGYDFPANLTNWFPHLVRRNLGYYTIHYTLYKDLTLISPGVKIDEREDGDYKTITYTTKGISYTSFAYGKYDILSDTVANTPFTLYIRQENTIGLFNRNKDDEFKEGLTDAFEAFYDWYGPPLAEKMRVVDQPRFLAQSSPGLIHLTFVTDLPSRFQPRIRAHEIAHQWWGHSVVPASFRDVWLSEGIAEYSAAMYVLRVLNDSSDYQEQINKWRRDVVEEGRIGGRYSKGYKAGPIIMGSNLFMSDSPGDYWALIYSKAAYMLEMLRFEIDGPEYRTDFFKLMLAEYRRKYFEKQASSIDFIRVAGQYLGDTRAAVFFKQWLFDWKIPDFTCRYSIKPDKRGRPVVEIDIEVSAVNPGFETSYPVEIEFADGTRRLFRIDGVGRKRSQILGPFPDAIKKVRFDPDHIILCRDTKVEKLR